MSYNIQEDNGAITVSFDDASEALKARTILALSGITYQQMGLDEKTVEPIQEKASALLKRTLRVEGLPARDFESLYRRGEAALANFCTAVEPQYGITMDRPSVIQWIAQSGDNTLPTVDEECGRYAIVLHFSIKDPLTNLAARELLKTGLEDDGNGFRFAIDLPGPGGFDYNIHTDRYENSPNKPLIITGVPEGGRGLAVLEALSGGPLTGTSSPLAMDQHKRPTEVRQQTKFD